MKKLFIFLTILFFIPFSLLAQKTVKGRILDDTGKPVAGATVVVKGSKKGTQTDKDGNFTITVPASGNSELVVSSIGFGTQEISSNGNDPISVQMKHETTTGDEVVVIGYQSIKRKNLTASVSSVSAKDLKDIPINSAAEALNGRLAGVTATTAEGSPDALVRIRVRGGMSITGDNSPLYVVDGVQVENAFNTISPQDIQSVDVLKDAAATSIYGARGGNGVFIITTKSGRQGKMIVSYNGYVGIKFLEKKLKVLTPYDYVIYQSERSRGSSADSTKFTQNFGSTWDTLANYLNVRPVDWQNEVFGNTGVMTTQNVSASGGTKIWTYNFGYTYNYDRPVVIGSSFERNLYNYRNDFNITKNLKAGFSMRALHEDVYGAGVSDTKGSSYNRLRNAVKYRPFLSSGEDIEDIDPLADINVGNGLNLVNPLDLAASEYRSKVTSAFNINLNASLKLMKNLTFRTVFGFDNNYLVDHQFSDSLTPYSIISGSRKPISEMDSTRVKTTTNTNTLIYSVKGWKGKHDLDVLIGQETYDLRTDARSNLIKLYPTFTDHDITFKNPGLGTPFAGYSPEKHTITRYTNASFFGRINYAFMDKYLLSANFRADGASKFAPGRQWGYFPGGSFAWRVKNEKFMENVDFINDLKFRVGFGLAGNNRIADYQYLTSFNLNSFFYGINNQSVPGYTPIALANPFLQWEATLNRNFGVDVTFLKHRFDLSVDYYNNTSNHLLLFVPIAATYGYPSQYQNIGKTSNKGVDLQLAASVIKKKNFTWGANFNISFNKNKIVALGVGQNSFFPPASWGVSGQPTDYIERVGDPVGSMWGLVTDGFYKVSDFDYNTASGAYTLKTGVVTDSAIIGVVQPGSIKFKDLDGDGTININKDRTIIGNPTPKFTGGLNQTFSYKQWDMSVFVNFSYGNDIYNANKIEFTNGYSNNSNMLAIMAGRWKVVTATGQTAEWVSGTQVLGIAPDQLAALNANATIWQPLKSAGAFYPSSWAIEDGSFLRINNVTIGYTIPSNKLRRTGLTKLRFYVTGNNLHIFTKYTGYDPEVSVSTGTNAPLTPGLDYSAYPKSRSFIFGVNAGF